MPSASRWPGVRHCYACCRSLWRSEAGRARATGLTTSCTPDSSPGFTIRASNRYKRSATTSRPTSSATCAGSARSVTSPASNGSSACAPDVSVSSPTCPRWVRTPASPHDGASLADDSGGELRRSPASAVLRQHPQTPGQVAEALLLRRGLASHLIGIENARQLTTHPLRGQLFENAVVAEALKHRFNRGRRSNLSFFRDVRDWSATSCTRPLVASLPSRSSPAPLSPQTGSTRSTGSQRRSRTSPPGPLSTEAPTANDDETARWCR